MSNKILVAGVLVLAGLPGTTSTMHAQRRFKETVTVQGSARDGLAGHALTFSGPVALPGVSLAPGRYIFRYLSSNVVQVSNASGDPYSMFITIPTTRQTALDRYDVVLGAPAAPGSPRRILALFAPGETSGQQFIYPNR